MRSSSRASGLVFSISSNNRVSHSASLILAFATAYDSSLARSSGMVATVTPPALMIAR